MRLFLLNFNYDNYNLVQGEYINPTIKTQSVLEVIQDEISFLSLLFFLRIFNPVS